MKLVSKCLIALAFMLVPLLSTTTVNAACPMGQYFETRLDKCISVHSTIEKDKATGTYTEVENKAGGTSVEQQTGKIRQYIEASMAGLIGVAIALSAMMTVFGGLLYTMSEGDPKKVQNAKMILLGAGVGAAIAVSSYVILALIKTTVGIT